MFDLVITGALVATGDSPSNLDVGISEGKIQALAPTGTLSGQAQRVITGTDCVLVPGGIEPHAHLHHPIKVAGREGQVVRSQSPEAGTRAAAFGGTTTVLDFAFPDHSASSPNIMESVIARRMEFENRCYVDYAFHAVITPAYERAALTGMAEAVDNGVSSFKVFTSGGPRRRNPPHMLDTGRLETVLRRAADLGAMVAVHAEDEDIVCEHVDWLREQGDDSLKNIPLAHSALSEQVAFQKVLNIANDTGAAIYFMHVTARIGTELIRRARAHGQAVYGEVLHNFLAYTSQEYQRADGALFHTFPGLKSSSDQDALWAGLLDGTLSCVATDDYTMPAAIKEAGQTVGTVCGGHAGIETRAMFLFSEGYLKGRLSLSEFVSRTSTKAAQIFGLYPRKGLIAVGSDADLVLWDPSVSQDLTLSGLHHDGDYSIWDGWTLRGKPLMTMVRGSVVVESGQLIADKPNGIWLERQNAQPVQSD